MRNFRKFDFWEDGISFSVKINKLTSSFPIEERFALADQLRRSASSIPSNIAEGAGRGTIADFSHFLDVAIGSSYEAETQLIIAQRSGYIREKETEPLIADLQSLQRRIVAFKKSLHRK